MPNVKLTLKLDAEVIARGKEYAAKHGSSLSKLVEADLRRRLLQGHEYDQSQRSVPGDVPSDNPGAAYQIYVSGPLDELSSPVPSDPSDAHTDRADYYEHMATKRSR